jgi:hypothetical protein
VAVDFIIVYRKAPAYPTIDLWLEAPDGTIVRPGDAGTTFPNFLFVTGDGHVYFRCQFPAFPDRPQAHIGRWRVWMASRRGKTALTHGYSQGSSVNFYYSVMAKARSDLRLNGFISQSSYEPGSPMLLVLEPTLYGQPVKLDAPVEARFTRPDGVIRIITLTETSYGRYSGTFDDTHQLGVYPVSTVVMATTPAGAVVTRYRLFTGLIFRHGQSGGDPNGGDPNGGDPNGENDPDCRKAAVAHKQLRALLLRLAEKHPEEREEILVLLRWLKLFIANCCKCKRSKEDSQKLQTILEKARQLLDEEEEP